MFAQFRVRATGMNATVHEPLARAELCTYLEQFLASRAETACAAPSLAAAMGALPRGVEIARDAHQIASAEIGMSEVDLAVAETGSLLLARAELLERLVSMLPAIHVALLPLERLVPSLEEAATFLRARAASPSYLSLVTGPSRTGDIELVHTIGVHGPAEVHVVPHFVG